MKPDKSYFDNVFTTGVVGYPGLTHIPDRRNGKKKNFNPVIEKALSLGGLSAKEGGYIMIGFGRDSLIGSADKIVDAIKAGRIKRFVVMAGCDGRQKSREYYTNFAKALPADSVILTAGCAKFRYNMLNLGDIDGIPRVLDAGQCNDSYSLVTTALKLKQVFGLDDINKLPISYNIAWYEQKALIVLLSLLYLGVKNIRLCPTLPAFLSKNVAGLLVEKFGIKGINSVNEDLRELIV